MEGEKNIEFDRQREKLVDQYAGSEWYQKLREQLRWSQFRADSTTAEAWQTEILDADANNGEHGFVNAMIAEHVCDIDGESWHTRKLVVSTSLLRDLGEAEFGDINYDAKKKVQKLKELVSLSDILNSGHFSALSEEEIEEIIDLRTYPPQFDLQRPEVEVFHHVQRLGWLRTGMIAAEAAHDMQKGMYGRSEENPAQYYRLLWLTHSVLGNHLPRVIESASDRESAKVFLVQNQEKLNLCFRTLLRDDVQDTLQNYYVGLEDAGLDPAKQDRKLITAWQRWHEFRDSLSEAEYVLDPERYVVDLDHLKSVVGALRRQNKRIVLTSGSFDITSNPHMRYIEAAKKEGDILIVGVDSDEKVRYRKGDRDGPPRPRINEEERAEMILHSRYGDYVIIKQQSWSPQATMRVVKPDVLILSEDTHYKDDPKAMAELREVCGEVKILKRMGGRTTSSMIRDLMLDIEPMQDEPEQSPPENNDG